MVMWLISVGIWIFVGLFSRRFNRPPKEEWLLRVPLRRWIKYCYLVLISVATLIAVALLAVAVAPFPPPAFLEVDNRFELTGAALSLGGVLAFLWLLLHYSDVVRTKEGLYVFHAFIPEDSIKEIRKKGLFLWIYTPGVRRTWNSWRGEAILPYFLWEFTPKTLQELQRLRD